jgi:hypothetical protein
VALWIYTYSVHAVYDLVPAPFRDYTGAGAMPPLFFDKTGCTLFNSTK